LFSITHNAHSIWNILPLFALIIAFSNLFFYLLLPLACSMPQYTHRTSFHDECIRHYPYCCHHCHHHHCHHCCIAYCWTAPPWLYLPCQRKNRHHCHTLFFLIPTLLSFLSLFPIPTNAPYTFSMYSCAVGSVGSILISSIHSKIASKIAFRHLSS